MSVFSITYKGPMTFFLEGELDMIAVPSLTAAISDSIGKRWSDHARPVQVDLHRLEWRRRDPQGGQGSSARWVRVLHGVHDGTQRVVELMGVEKTTNIHVLPSLIAV